MENKKDNRSINWIAFIGFFLILAYFYLIFATYNNIYPSLNLKLSDDYPPFENPGGSFWVAGISSLAYLIIKIFFLFIMAGILYGLFYCGKEVVNALEYVLGKINKKIEQNEQKTKETPKEKGPNSARNR